MEDSVNCTDANRTLSYDQMPNELIILMRINGFFIIFLNVQVVLCLVVKRSLFRSSYWAQVKCLSLGDVLSGIGVWLMSTVETQLVKTNLTLCSMAHVFLIISEIATLLNIFWICVRRYWTMRRMVVRERDRTIKDVVGQMVIVWLISTCYCVLPFAVWLDPPCQMKACSFSTIFGRNHTKSVGYLDAGIFVLLILTNIVYLALSKKLRESLRSRVYPMVTSGTSGAEQDGTCVAAGSYSDRNLNGATAQSQTAQLATISGVQKQRENPKVELKIVTNKRPVIPNHVGIEEARMRNYRKAAMTIGIVLILLNTFTWPTAVVSVLSVVKTITITYECQLVLSSLITLNSLMNPIVYALKMTEFRQALKALYCD